MAEKQSTFLTRFFSRLLISLFLFIGSVITSLVFYLNSLVFGAEFSPDDFTKRSFTYRKLPGLNWVISGIVYEPITNDFEKSLIDDGLIPVSSPPNQTWHLYHENQSVQPAECDARFLVHHLTLQSDNTEFQYYWEWWNEQHPDLAKVFWPEIAQMARDEMYLAVPDVMKMAMSLEHQKVKPNTAEFAEQLHELIAGSYQRFGTIDEANGKSDRAKLRFDRAQEYLSR